MKVRSQTLKNCLKSDDSCDNEQVDTDIDDNFPHDHRIIDMDLLNSNVSESVLSAFCGNSVRLIETSRHGLSSTLAFHSSNNNCNKQTAFPTSKLISVENLSVHSMNRRAVLVMRAELQTFCGVMDLPPPVHSSSYIKINQTLETAACDEQNISTEKAGEREYEQAEPLENENVRNIDDSFDGTWMTQGHLSMIGVASTIGCSTGQVLEVGTRSKVCKSCQVWKKRNRNTANYRKWQCSHKCTLTHNGSFGSMEVNIVKDMFGRSEDKHSLRYTHFIGDGDTNIYKSVADSKPYGRFSVKQLECVGHVQKRTGTRLRSLKAKMKGQVLSDGKKIGKKRETGQCSN